MLKWYIITPLFFILFFLYMFLQALFYKTRYYTIPLKAGVRMMHLTDIHIGLLFISAKRIRRTIEKSKPDYILISGDLLDKPSELKKLVRWFREINIKVPAYAVLGNHDHQCIRKYPHFMKEYLQALKELGIHVLINEVVLLEREEQQKPCAVALIGLDDYKTGTQADNTIFNGLHEKSKCIVAFSHNPDIVLHIPESSTDLLLTGHFHGGQIWMPFNLEYTFLRKDQISRMGHYKGFATIRGNRMYISRGLGTVVVPFRFFSVPEITIIDF